jgi:hypothetical protein
VPSTACGSIFSLKLAHKIVNPICEEANLLRVYVFSEQGSCEVPTGWKHVTRRKRLGQTHTVQGLVSPSRVDGRVCCDALHVRLPDPNHTTECVG